MHTKQEYERWGEVHEHASIERFEETNLLSPGVHLIFLDGGVPLELLVGGDIGGIVADSRIPVFFSGAITWRNGTYGPFFSGRRIAARLGTSFLAFSDPLLMIDNDLTIGWYTGLSAWNTLEVMDRVCHHIAKLTNKNLLFIGGSSGGFAALSMAARDDQSMAFVWNPQTAILEYNKKSVREYLSVMFDGNWEEDGWRELAESALSNAGITHDLRTISAPKNFFYIQNSSDWHVDRHCLPYIKSHGLSFHEDGYFGGARNQGVQIGNFGAGHAPPTKDVLDLFIKELLPESGNFNVVKNLARDHGLLDDASLKDLL